MKILLVETTVRLSVPASYAEADAVYELEEALSGITDFLDRDDIISFGHGDIIVRDGTLLGGS